MSQLTKFIVDVFETLADYYYYLDPQQNYVSYNP